MLFPLWAPLPRHCDVNECLRCHQIHQLDSKKCYPFALPKPGRCWGFCKSNPFIMLIYHCFVTSAVSIWAVVENIIRWVLRLQWRMFDIQWRWGISQQQKTFQWQLTCDNHNKGNSLKEHGITISFGRPCNVFLRNLALCDVPLIIFYWSTGAAKRRAALKWQSRLFLFLQYAYRSTEVLNKQVMWVPRHNQCSWDTSPFFLLDCITSRRLHLHAFFNVGRGKSVSVCVCVCNRSHVFVV